MWLINNDVDAGKLRKIYFFNTGILGSAHSVSFACICGAVHAMQRSEHESFSLLLVVYLPFHCRGSFATDPSPSRVFLCLFACYVDILFY